jgi:hypothetical protein
MTPTPRDAGSAAPDPASFLSGDAGDVTDLWRRAKRAAGEIAYTALDTLSGTRRRAARLARETPPRDVLVIGVYRAGSSMPDALHHLHSERHNVRIALGAIGGVEQDAIGGARTEAVGRGATAGGRDSRLDEHTVAEGLGGGKFQNLNRVLAASGSEAGGADWVLVVDDDVLLPAAFLDGFVAVCEAFGLDLAQPAQTLRSHSAWKVTRRRPASIVRDTRFVEIGPVTAFSRRAAAELLPFPELRYGWGLDLHWAAIAGQRGWGLGVVDALPVRHESGLVAATYPREEAEAEAARFLAGRPYLPSARAGEVLAVHRRVST